MATPPGMYDDHYWADWMVMGTPTLAPIGGHNPVNRDRREYPELGRTLQREDIGKQIVRTKPRASIGRDGFTYYDWSFVPPTYLRPSQFPEESIKLLALKDDKLLSEESQEFENDGNWTTLDEFLQHIKK